MINAVYGIAFIVIIAVLLTSVATSGFLGGMTGFIFRQRIFWNPWGLRLRIACAVAFRIPWGEWTSYTAASSSLCSLFSQRKQCPGRFQGGNGKTPSWRTLKSNLDMALVSWGNNVWWFVQWPRTEVLCPSPSFVTLLSFLPKIS